MCASYTVSSEFDNKVCFVKALTKIFLVSSHFLISQKYISKPKHAFYLNFLRSFLTDHTSCRRLVTKIKTRPSSNLLFANFYVAFKS